MITSAIIKHKAKKRAQDPDAFQIGPMPENPIVLCHGLFGFDTLFGIVNYWRDAPKALRTAGAEVLVTRVSPTSATEDRARELLAQVNKEYAGRSVHLIGHSMGGLDCRYLVSHLMENATFKVLSVTTVSTPHWGSPVADVVMSSHVTEVPGFEEFMNLLPMGKGDGGAFESLSTEKAREFNATTPNVEGVRYLSWGCRFVPGVIDAPVWLAPYGIIHSKEGQNDGMVSVSSAKWGEYLGTIKGVNHTEIIGHKFTETRPRDLLNAVTGKMFDYQKFYLEHAKYLAENVE
ncbi:hypothetical protein FRC11_006864 [Ceratobasidium sp. 423]|nr:hypothetical protein FRC11_006864 [Ceratobasidium sp. 423]